MEVQFGIYCVVVVVNSAYVILNTKKHQALHCTASGGAAVTNAVCIFAAVRQCNNDDLLHPHDTSYGRKCTMMAVALFQEQQSLVSWFPGFLPYARYGLRHGNVQFKMLALATFVVGFKPASQIYPHILAKKCVCRRI